MSLIRIQAPARLHFGLLGWGPHAVRQFGGFGLMVDSPCLGIAATIAERDSFDSSSVEPERIVALIESIRARLRANDRQLPPVRIRVESGPPPHHGLGSGTQLALTVAEAALLLAGHAQPTKDEVIATAGRFPRSGVGTHGYFAGGLIVDDGHPADQFQPRTPARLLRRCEWPDSWRIVTLFPQEVAGPSGRIEAAAFERLPPPTSRSMDAVSERIHHGFLPAVDSIEPDFHAAMDALEAVQTTVGSWFAPAQGGHVFGSEARDRIVARLRDLGLRGLGQSSWGPTLFGFSVEDEARLEARLEAEFGPGSHRPVACKWTITRADNTGRRVRTEPAGEI